jgi:hypothetical protein
MVILFYMVLAGVADYAIVIPNFYAKTKYSSYA